MAPGMLPSIARANSNGLAGLDRTEGLQNSASEFPQILKLIRWRTQDNDCDGSGCRSHLMRYALVDGQQDFVASSLGGLK